MAGVRTQEGVNFFLYSTVSRLSLKPYHPHVQWVLGALSAEAERPERGADYSPPSSAEVENGGTITSFPIRLLILLSLYH
jgi:hypothetical protein